MIKKIISGGQTGADRAALDFAIRRGFDTGGWIPKGRLAEDGPLPDSYLNLKETSSAKYQQRTRLNVADSDGTLILFHGELTGGSLLTAKIAASQDKPCLHLDIQTYSTETAAGKVKAWAESNRVRKLNVAGPRASNDPLIYDKTIEVLTLLFD